jgi:single-stranded-DNA-specific exonuclease
VPGEVDVAYRVRLDRWQGEERLQLELVALRQSCGEEVVLQRRDRTYWCRRRGDQLVIRNAVGEELFHPLPAPLATPFSGQGEGAAALPHPYLRSLVREAAMALGLAG